MPLMRVRDLVRHASQHGYLVASFKIHGAEEAQSVVNAAEAARAPAIIAVDERSPVFLRHEITLAIAESLASSSSVPVAVEVVSWSHGSEPLSSRMDSVVADGSPPMDGASPHAAAVESVALRGTEARDREMWFSAPAATELAEAARAGCRVGFAIEDPSEAGLRPAALRKQLQNLQVPHRYSLVVDGDLPWPNATFRSLPGLGVTKVNYDNLLGMFIAKAYRRAAQKAGDHYRTAVEEAFTALVGEVVERLRRAGGSGRAADVMACVADEEPESVRAHASVAGRGMHRSADATPPGFPRRAAWQGGHASFID